MTPIKSPGVFGVFYILCVDQNRGSTGHPTGCSFVVEQQNTITVYKILVRMSSGGLPFYSIEKRLLKCFSLSKTSVLSNLK
jgi:hypothetical protein